MNPALLCIVHHHAGTIPEQPGRVHRAAAFVRVQDLAGVIQAAQGHVCPTQGAQPNESCSSP